MTDPTEVGLVLAPPPADSPYPLPDGWHWDPCPGWPFHAYESPNLRPRQARGANVHRRTLVITHVSVPLAVRDAVCAKFEAVTGGPVTRVRMANGSRVAKHRAP